MEHPPREGRRPAPPHESESPRRRRAEHRPRRRVLGILFEIFGIISFAYLVFKYAIVPLLVLACGWTGGTL